MLHRILVNVVQSGEIRVPVGEFRFPEVMPNLAPRRIVPLIDPFGCLLMKQTDHRSKIVRVFIGGMCYEVVMIGKNGPSFKMPAKLLRYRKQTALKHPESIATAEMMRFLVSAGSHDVSTARR